MNDIDQRQVSLPSGTRLHELANVTLTTPNPESCAVQVREAILRGRWEARARPTHHLVNRCMCTATTDIPNEPT